MNDWRSKVEISRRDGYKAAAAVLGLLFLLIFLLTSLQRFVLRDKDEAATRRAQRRQQRANRRGARA